MPSTVAANGAVKSEITERIVLHGADLRMITVRIENEPNSPLIMHRWSEKAKKQMRDKQEKKASKNREVRDPHQEFIEATYFIDRDKQDRYGLPASAFMSAILDAALACGAKKSETRRALKIRADALTQDMPLVEIFAEKPRMREDMVTVGISGTDLRYRPEFAKWSATLTIVYDARQISGEQIVNLVNQAGFSVGVGEWRHERDGGSCGAFRVVAG